MAYMALYRKWRPQDFSVLIGQEHISKTLSNAIISGKIAHAYLFSGPRGTGKTSTAKILAKALNCKQGPTPTPCNQCVCCQKINDGSFMDVFEIDAASNRGIDEIRDLRETVKFAPVDGRYKVYIIDEVHMLTTEAFNALLKTLEEPPSHVVFILATTEVHKVPVTIQSRCQRYDFKRITKDDILGQLITIVNKMQIKAEQNALEIIAIQADGGMRDALSLLDQCLAFTKNELTADEVKKVLGLVGHDWIWQITDDLIAKDSKHILTTINEVIIQGKELKQLLNEFILHLRSLMLYKASGKILNSDMYFEDENILKKQSEAFSHEEIVSMIQKVHEAINEIKWAFEPRITVEVLFLKLCWQEEHKQIENKQYDIPMISKNATNDAKIVALEQQIARLERIVKALSTQVANLNEKNLQSQSTLANVVIPKQSLTLTNKVNTKNDVDIKPKLQNLDITAIWQNVLLGLNARHKIVITSCVNKAVPYKITNNQFFIHFNSTFLQARTEKEDYSSLIEDILYDITGEKLKLVCTCSDSVNISNVSPFNNEKTANAPSITAPKITIPMIEDDFSLPQENFMEDIPMPTDDDYVPNNDDINYEDLTPEGKHTLKTALEVFGGKIIPEDKMNN